MRTLESPLTVVDEQVSLQGERGPEQSFAFFTLEWPLFRVRLLVILVNISVGKSLSTKLAFVRFVFTVYNFVGTHLIKPLERFITNLTIIGSFLCEK